MSSGPVVPMVWEGLNVVKTGRVMLGATNPADSAPGTIRGDFCIQVGRNICHGSDAVDSAAKGILLFENFSVLVLVFKIFSLFFRNCLVVQGGKPRGLGPSCRKVGVRRLNQ